MIPTGMTATVRLIDSTISSLFPDERVTWRIEKLATTGELCLYLQVEKSTGDGRMEIRNQQGKLSREQLEEPSETIDFLYHLMELLKKEIQWQTPTIAVEQPTPERPTDE